MPTIYRFIVEQKTTSGGGGRKSDKESSGTSKKGPGKKGRYVSIFGGEKGGVEHNRKMRALNPLFNKATHGGAEKGMRLGRAGMGLITKNTETGKYGLSGPAVAIIIAFVIQAIFKWQSRDAERSRKINENNFKAMENGGGAIHGQYTVSANTWNGALTYNQNK